MFIMLSRNISLFATNIICQTFKCKFIGHKLKIDEGLFQSNIIYQTLFKCKFIDLNFFLILVDELERGDRGLASRQIELASHVLLESSP